MQGHLPSHSWDCSHSEGEKTCLCDTVVKWPVDYYVLVWTVSLESIAWLRGGLEWTLRGCCLSRESQERAAPGPGYCSLFFSLPQAQYFSPWKDI